MPITLTDGETKIGVYKFSDHKKMALCIEKDNMIEVYGYFNTADLANEFMERLVEFMNVDMEIDKYQKGEE